MSDDTSSEPRHRLLLFGQLQKPSLSPDLHNAGLRELGLHDWCYESCSVEPADFVRRFEEERGRGFRGANVTIPYKERVVGYCDRLEPMAEKLGAVNTLVETSGRLAGYNTDVDGITQPLRALDFTPARESAVIFGAGGAARALVGAQSQFGITSLTLVARGSKRAKAMAAKLTERFEGVTIDCFDPSDAYGVRSRLEAAQLIANATPVGSSHCQGVITPVDPVRPDTLIFDCVYEPQGTEWIRLAQAAGLPTVDGLTMLLNQAFRAFELWTGSEAPREAMARALDQS